MTVTDLRIVNSRSGVTEVWLDGAPWERVQPDTVVLFHLKRGMNLNDNQLTEIRASNVRLLARQALARYSALKVRSSRQGRDYLMRRGFDEDVIDATIEDAAQRGWINDQDFADAFVRRRAAVRPAGPSRLRSELMAKGIDGDTAEDAIARYGPDPQSQRDRARAAALKRMAAWRGRYDAPALRQRLRDYLARQGYDSDLIREIVEGLAEPVE